MTHGKRFIVWSNQVELKYTSSGIRNGYLDTTTTSKEGSLELTRGINLGWLFKSSGAVLPVDRQVILRVRSQRWIVLSDVLLKSFRSKV